MGTGSMCTSMIFDTRFNKSEPNFKCPIPNSKRKAIRNLVDGFSTIFSPRKITTGLVRVASILIIRQNDHDVGFVRV